MSGTSLDGVDAAVLTTDGEGIAVSGAACRRRMTPICGPYSAPLSPRRAMWPKGPVPHSIREAERRVTEAHAETVMALLAKAGRRAGESL